MRQVLQVRSKRHWRAIEPSGIRFASGLIRKLRQIKLPPIGLPMTVTRVAHPWRINRRYLDARPLRIRDRLLQIRILMSPLP